MKDDLSTVFKALGHPRRLQIIKRLMKRVHICCKANRKEDCCLEEPVCDFSELVEELGIHKATLSLDLKELRYVGLIQTIKNGRKVSIQVNPQKLMQLKDFFEMSIDRQTRQRMENLRSESDI